MNDLSIDIKTHVLITYRNSHHWITARENELLKQVGRNDVFNTGGNRIFGSDIAEVLTVEKYRETYPEKNQYYGQPQSSKVYPDLRSLNLSQNGLLSMMKGLKRAINEFRAQGHEPTKALKEYERLKIKFKALYGGLPVD